MFWIRVVTDFILLLGVPIPLMVIVTENDITSAETKLADA